MVVCKQLSLTHLRLQHKTFLYLKINGAEFQIFYCPVYFLVQNNKFCSCSFIRPSIFINLNLFQIKAIILIVPCDATIKEAKQFITTCHKLQKNCVTSSTDNKELLILLTTVTRTNAIYTAAGFFDIDRTTIFGLLSVITTYFIVIVQFNK